MTVFYVFNQFLSLSKHQTSMYSKGTDSFLECKQCGKTEDRAALKVNVSPKTSRLIIEPCQTLRWAFFKYLLHFSFGIVNHTAQHRGRLLKLKSIVFKEGEAKG